MKTINNRKTAIFPPVISVSLRNHQGDVIRVPEGFLSKLINDANEVASNPSHELLSLHINMRDTLTRQYRVTVMIGRPSIGSRTHTVTLRNRLRIAFRTTIPAFYDA